MNAIDTVPSPVNVESTVAVYVSVEPKSWFVSVHSYECINDCIHFCCIFLTNEKHSIKTMKTVRYIQKSKISVGP